MGALTGGSTPGPTSDFWYMPAFMSRGTTSGEKVTEDTALTLPAYYACLRTISEDVAKLPMALFQETGETKVKVPKTHPVQKFLADLNPNTIPLAVRESVTGLAQGWGFAIAEIQRSGGRPIALWPIHSSRVTPKMVDGQPVWDVLVDDIDHDTTRSPGSTVRLLDDEVFVLRGFGANSMVGYSVLRYAAESIGLGLATQRFGAAFFGNGATPSIIIKHPGKLDKDAATRLRESWESAHQGSGKARRPVVVEEGITIDQMTINPNDGQFLETRGFQIEEICRWFRLPPVKIQHNQNTPYSNIETLDQTYVKDTLTPWLTRWEQEARRKLLTTGEQAAGYFFDHDTEEQLRGDPAKQAEVDRTNIMSGVASINEVRGRRRLPAVPGGDVHLMQQGMTTLEVISTGATVKSNPTPQQQPQRAEAASVIEPVLAYAADRMVDRELKAIARIEQKNESKAAKLGLAVEFFTGHASVMIENMKPVAAVWLNLTGQDRGAHIDALCVDYCNNHPQRWERGVPTGADLAGELMAALKGEL